MFGYVMEVLFVCKANVGRSQIAEALFEKFKNDPIDGASSAGINPGYFEGQKVGVVGPNVTRAMKERGIDVSDKRSKMLTREMFENADRVIFILDARGEIPEFAEGNKKVLFWKVEDAVNKNLEYEYIRNMRDAISRNVKKLIASM
jgi:arsenate reductase